jgi:hypothetical protein
LLKLNYPCLQPGNADLKGRLSTIMLPFFKSKSTRRLAVVSHPCSINLI